MVESDGQTPTNEPEIARRLDAIIALLAVIAAALVLDLVGVDGRGAVVALVAVAVWTAILTRSGE